MNVIGVAVVMVINLESNQSVRRRPQAARRRLKSERGAHVGRCPGGISRGQHLHRRQEVEEEPQEQGATITTARPPRSAPGGHSLTTRPVWRGQAHRSGPALPSSLVFSRPCFRSRSSCSSTPSIASVLRRPRRAKRCLLTGMPPLSRLSMSTPALTEPSWKPSPCSLSRLSRVSRYVHLSSNFITETSIMPHLHFQY